MVQFEFGDDMRITEIIYIYASGLFELILSALGGAIVILMTVHLICSAYGTSVDAELLLILAWQIIVFFALWPGQQFWTIRRATQSGREHSVIGSPSDEDLRYENHRRAQRMSNALRD
ncbi:MAG: hypothetical protein AAGF27_04730 [Pseudomonadota bacterium]